jgi:diguanylate cyclase (GGDEF)-like protein
MANGSSFIKPITQPSGVNQERAHWTRRIGFKIETKLFLSYLPLILIMFLLVAYPLLNLKKANDLSRNIAENDVVALDLASRMIDDLTAQESHAGRFLILGSNAMHDYFWERSDHFDSLLKELETLQNQSLTTISAIKLQHEAYNALYAEEFAKKRSNPEWLPDTAEDKTKIQLDQLISSIRNMDVEIRLHQKQLLDQTEKNGRQAILITSLLLFSGILIAGITALVMTRGITRGIQQLKFSVTQIANGKFDAIPQIRSGDELEDLATAFADMACRLSHLEENSLDANPLTRLPGGRAIETVLMKRIGSNLPYALCVIDLDNFKAFNDRYGYSRGNEVIKKTADIINAAVLEHGSPDDFIGHIGGDDFTVITAPECLKTVCQSIIEAFDGQIISLYDEDDQKTGCIISKSRQGQTLKFPIMTISIAVVTDQTAKGLNYIEVAEIAAELKAHAKSLEGSIFVENRRLSSI